jgi:hypothetical protein
VAAVLADDGAAEFAPSHARDIDREEDAHLTRAEPAGSLYSAPVNDDGSGPGECLALLSLLLWLLLSVVSAARPKRPIAILRRAREQSLLLGRPPDRPRLHRLSILRC